MRFEFATAVRIVFGAGTVREAGQIAHEFGRSALVVTGKNPGRADGLIDLLRQQNMESRIYVVSGEPDIGSVERGVAQAKEAGCDFVISFGGGSAIDAGKAIAAMLSNEGQLLDYLEVVGQNKPLQCPPAPFMAIPTTAGTGSEVTRNSVLASPEHRVKVSLRSPLMLARVAIIDPELTYDLPPSLTASTGLDALTQLIEPYVCSRANPMTDALCLEGIPRVARALRRAYENSQDPVAREDMSVASLFGGLALANAGLGAVHGFAGPIGGMFPAPHGAVCAALLPHVIATNILAAKVRSPGGETVRKYDRIAQLLTGKSEATANDGVQWVRELVTGLGIPPLKTYGVRPSDVMGLVEKASKASSMKANPLPLTRDELTEVLHRAI